MFRSTVIRSILDYIRSNYTGPVVVAGQEDDAELIPPYAIVRVGSAEDMGGNQAEIWDLNVLVGVRNDAEECTAVTAEERAAGVFAVLVDPDALAAALSPGIVVSWWQPLTVEASIDGTHWQHVAGYRLVAAPGAEDEHGN